MKFELKEWRRFYDKIHALGQMLRDSRPTYTEKGSYIAPICELSKDAQHELESQIQSLSQRCGRYLDQCGMRMPKPLWYYDRKDPKTWRSHESFKYGHLLEF